MKRVTNNVPARMGLLALGLILGGAGVVPGAVVILTNGSRVEGRNLRLNAQGDYVLEGNEGIRTFRAGQVDRAEADKPAGYDEAWALRSSQPDEALRRLTQIARSYRGLGWDAQAWFAVAEIAGQLGRDEEAIQAYERMPIRAFQSNDVRLKYWSALVRTQKYAKLMPILDQAIRTADRPMSARATLMRGNARLGKGQQEPALLDYLRVWTLYGDVRETQPEALYRAADLLQQLQDQRAEKLFEELEREYPDSPWAGRARERS